MGQAISQARDQVLVSTQDNKNELEEQLSFLVRLAVAKLDNYQAELEAMFMTENPKNSHRGGIPGFRALRWERAYSVDVAKVEDFQTAINNTVDAFFGTPDKTDAIQFSIQSGFKIQVNTALKNFLANKHAGEHEEQKFFIFMQHNAIIRIDVKLWRYNFVSSKVMGEKTDVLAYIFCTSVVDHDVLQDDELLYLLSEYAGDKNLAVYLSKLVSMWTIIKSVTADAKDPKNRVQLWANGPTSNAITANVKQLASSESDNAATTNGKPALDDKAAVAEPVSAE